MAGTVAWTPVVFGEGRISFLPSGVYKFTADHSILKTVS